MRCFLCTAAYERQYTEQNDKQSPNPDAISLHHNIYGCNKRNFRNSSYSNPIERSFIAAVNGNRAILREWGGRATIAGWLCLHSSRLVPSRLVPPRTAASRRMLVQWALHVSTQVRRSGSVRIRTHLLLQGDRAVYRPRRWLPSRLQWVSQQLAAALALTSRSASR